MLGCPEECIGNSGDNGISFIRIESILVPNHMKFYHIGRTFGQGKACYDDHQITFLNIAFISQQLFTGFNQSFGVFNRFDSPDKSVLIVDFL